MRELIPHAPEPFPSREPFSHGISKLRIQTEDSQGQPGAPVAPTLQYIQPEKGWAVVFTLTVCQVT